MSEILGQPVVVDNRPGANTMLGSENVARSPADGYTIMLGSIVTYIYPFFSKNVPIDVMKDLVPISIPGVTPNAVAVHPSVPVHNMRELIDYAKRNPGKIFYGTTGVGSTHHLAGVMLSQMTGINIEHVAYKGGNPSITDAVGGQIPMVILTSSTIMPFVREGKLRALAVIEGKRARISPDLPTIGETVPGYAMPDTFFCVVAPTGTPRDIVGKLNDVVHQAVQSPEVKKRLEDSGFEATGNLNAEQVQASINRDLAVYRKIIQTANIKPE
jgi:tripartite-type tricarboxylate transporter receptor subunit TctC